MDPAKLEAAARAVNAEEIIEEVEKIPARYLKPFEKPTNSVTSKKRKARQKWTNPDDMAAAMTYRRVEKEHGKYQNVNEDHKHVNTVFAGKQRFVRNKWPKYANVPKYKPRTCQALAERLTKKSSEYEAFFKNPDNNRIAEVLDGIKNDLLFDRNLKTKQPLKKRIVDSQKASKAVSLLLFIYNK